MGLGVGGWIGEGSAWLNLFQFLVLAHMWSERMLLIFIFPEPKQISTKYLICNHHYSAIFIPGNHNESSKKIIPFIV